MCFLRSNTFYHQSGRPAADSAVGVAAPLVTVPVVAFVASVVVLVDVA